MANKLSNLSKIVCTLAFFLLSIHTTMAQCTCTYTAKTTGGGINEWTGGNATWTKTGTGCPGGSTNPTTTDCVVIPAGATINTTTTPASISVFSITVSGGTLNLVTPTSITLNNTSGTLAVTSGSLTIPITVTTLSANSVSVSAGATLGFLGATATSVSGATTINGAFSTVGGSYSSASLTINSNNAVSFANTTVNISGNVSVANGTSATDLSISGGSFTVGGDINIASGATVSAINGANVFIQGGTNSGFGSILNVTGPNSTWSTGTMATNSTINVNNGTLRIRNTGDSFLLGGASTVNLANSATFYAAGNLVLFNNSSALNLVSTNTSTFTIAGCAYNGGNNCNVVTNNINLSGSYCIACPLSISNTLCSNGTQPTPPQAAGGTIGCITLLPVTFVNISATYQQKTAYVAVNWATSVEINNAKFEVQRSLDGLNYYTIGTITPQMANSTSTLYYEYIDKTLPKANTIYYRIKQTDIDGQYSYSKLVVAQRTNKIAYSNIYPNPSDDGNIFIHIEGDESAKMLVSYMTLQGKLLFREELSGVNGTTKFNSKENLSTGIYLVCIETENNVFYHKLQVVR